MPPVWLLRAGPITARLAEFWVCPGNLSGLLFLGLIILHVKISFLTGSRNVSRSHEWRQDDLPLCLRIASGQIFFTVTCQAVEISKVISCKLPLLSAVQIISLLFTSCASALSCCWWHWACQRLLHTGELKTEQGSPDTVSQTPKRSQLLSACSPHLC